MRLKPKELFMIDEIIDIIQERMDEIGEGTSADRWEDPGDYPNSLASGPLPPGPWYLEDLPENEDVEISWDKLESDDPLLVNEDEDPLFDQEGTATGARGIEFKWTVTSYQIMKTGLLVSVVIEEKQ